MRVVFYYRFFESNDLHTFYLDLLQYENKKHLVGFYNLEKNHCYCYSDQQKQTLKSILSKYNMLNYEYLEYYDGNEHDIIFSIPNKEQPLVHVCPLPVISEKDGFIINEEFWGLTTNGKFCFNEDLDTLIKNQITGLSLTNKIRNYYIYDIDSILNNSINIDKGKIKLNGIELPNSDIFKFPNGVIIISIALARILKKYWKGEQSSRFQPVIYENLSDIQIKALCRNIKYNKIANSIQKDMTTLEDTFQFKLPIEYIEWLIERAECLPEGWLSPKGGLSSEIYLTTLDERENADPALPKELVAIYAVGNGDYICIKGDSHNKDNIQFVYWSHDDSTVKDIPMPNGFQKWIINYMNEESC